MKLVTTMVVIAGFAANMAAAKPHLRDVAEIDDPLYYALVAYEISENCAELSARKLKGLNDAWALARKAKSLGYSSGEIKAYIKSDEEKARMRSRGEAYFKSKGVSYDAPQTLCALGRAEIKRNSAIGVYLRAK